MQDAVANHLGGPALPGLPVRIKSFLHACAAVGAVRTFKAAAQASVAMVAVTVAIARHLVNHRRSPGGSFIRFRLCRSNQADSGQLLLRQERREFVSRSRTGGMERWNSRLLIQL